MSAFFLCLLGIASTGISIYAAGYFRHSEGALPGRPIYLICRSGIRSQAAAQFLAERGYHAYNVTDGFEGPIDPDGHRGASGWRSRRSNGRGCGPATGEG